MVTDYREFIFIIVLKFGLALDTAPTQYIISSEKNSVIVEPGTKGGEGQASLK